MKKTLFTLLFGGSMGALAGGWYQQSVLKKPEDSVDYDVIRNYVNDHDLKVSNKVNVFRAYAAYSKSFMDYGLLVKLNGFSFFEVRFSVILDLLQTR
jgi:hypothetical protein